MIKIKRNVKRVEIRKLGKSGVQRFKRCAIWIWNEEVMTVWRWTAQSQSGNFLISQPRPHFEGCFAAAKPPFGTRVPLRSTHTPISQLWNGLRKFPSSAKSTLRCENVLSFKNGLRNFHFVAKWFPNFQMDVKWFPNFEMVMKWSPSFKMATKMLQASKWAAKLPFGCEMISQPHSYTLWNPPFAVKMAFWLWNDFQTSI